MTLMVSVAAPSLPFHNRLLLNRHRRTSSTPFTVRSPSLTIQGTVTTEKSTKELSVQDQLSPELRDATPFPSIKTAKRVVLVRHGQSTWNAEGRIQGSSDFAVLTKKGESQAETSRQMLIDDSFDVCFSSPLVRSKRTAEIIWGNRGEEILTDSDLREIDLYSFQGLLKHEGKAKFGAAYRQWQVDAANFIIDGHFPVRELWSRARNCWPKILTQDGMSVLVVAHNAVNQALVATAIGLGTEYFRKLLQSNCGVSVLDFTPRVDGGSPYICLNRLNQTPGSPVASGTGGRKTGKRIILVCQGTTVGDTEPNIQNSDEQPMNMLGMIQSQKIAELLLDLKIGTIVSSPMKASVETATAISRVQEAADCLGADCVPRYVEMKIVDKLDVSNIILQLNKDTDNLQGLLGRLDNETLSSLWEQSGNAWQSLLKELTDDSEQEKIVVVVGHPVIHLALLGHCLQLTKDWLDSFHVDPGSISVLDFPDGPTSHGVVRCINYTAHLGRWSIPITRSSVDDEEF